MAQSLPPYLPVHTVVCTRFAERFREDGISSMGAIKAMLALEQQLKTYEEELTRLRVENDQLRRSSQAFGELAERLSIALQTATRVNRKSGGEPARLRSLES